MDVCVYSVFMLSCVGSGFATGWSPVRGVLSTVLGLTNWSETKRFTDAVCSKVGATGKEKEIRDLQKFRVWQIIIDSSVIFAYVRKIWTSNGGRSPSSGFPICPRASANSKSLQGLNFSNSLTHSLTHQPTTSLHFTSLHFTSLHFTSLHFTQLNCTH
jgi:hypothetical protein